MYPFSGSDDTDDTDDTDSTDVIDSIDSIDSAVRSWCALCCAVWCTCPVVCYRCIWGLDLADLGPCVVCGVRVAVMLWRSEAAGLLMHQRAGYDPWPRGHERAGLLVLRHSQAFTDTHRYRIPVF